MAIQEKVAKALRKAGYSDEEIQLETTESGRVAGFVISDKFAGKSQIKRQKKLWDQLEEQLSSDDLRKIVSILTMTPAETEDDEDVIKTTGT